MSWRIRHEGSPKEVSNVSLAQIVEGLQDGQWSLDDEVFGPGDRQWTPIHDHPKFEEVTEALEAAAEAENAIEHDPEEDRIDMNPLIDVCLVLLVFFILATTMAVMERVLDVPEAKKGKDVKVNQVSWEQVQKTMIMVKAHLKDGRPVVMLDTIEVTPEQLPSRLKALKAETNKSQIVIDAKDVDWQTIVGIIDAAAGAGIQKVNFKVDTSGDGGGAPAK